MGKQGPCHHCGVTSTPLWRNGPPEKPVLCNACGSRWRTKGTLANYTPLHARPEPDDFKDCRVSKEKSIYIKNKEEKVLKRRQNHENIVVGGVATDHNPCFQKVLDEDTGRSSSGSALSNSESCLQFGSADASDLTGPAQSVVWDAMVPSRKRTCVSRPKPSPVEKLTKELYTILHEQQSSYFSGSSEEDLLFETDRPMVSVEIGHGSVLIRHPNSIAREEESEASSLSFDNKSHPGYEAYSCLTALPLNIDNKGFNFQRPGIEDVKKLTGPEMQPEQTKRDKAVFDKLQILGNLSSPLHHMDLKDVLNFNKFASHLTKEEQQQLLNYLPSVDTARLPDSLESMFDSSQFKENISSFQKLIAEGVFDLSFTGGKTEDCRTLKKFALCNFTKSKWVELYSLLKDVKCKNGTGRSVNARELNGIISANSVNLRRLGGSKDQSCPGAKMTMKSPKSVKSGCEHKELIDNDGSCFSPGSLFALPPDCSSFMLDSCHAHESSDQDLLLDVPSNSSFPQAELLFPTSFCTQASASSTTECPHLACP